MKNRKWAMRQPRKEIVLGVTLALALGTVLAVVPGEDVAVESIASEEPGDNTPVHSMPESEMRGISPLTGQVCAEDGQEPHRPVAVMLAGDDRVRPLSGIGQAGLVVEMPVVTWGINRFMAVFACGGDFEIGSIRSSRDDYIPLAEGFGAIYGHWGGSYLALNQLNSGIMDNVDALRNPYGAYYRKSGIPAPDNGFTTITRMLSAAEQLGYETEARPEDLFVRSTAAAEEAPRAESFEVGYFGPYRVNWEYDEESKRYLRARGGRAEYDLGTDEQITAATVVTLRTRVTQRYGQYNDVSIAGGSGEAVVYAFGHAQKGTWQKGEELGAPLTIVDEAGKPIPFAPGPVWIQVIQTDTPVTVSLPRETDENLDTSN